MQKTLKRKFKRQATGWVKIFATYIIMSKKAYKLEKWAKGTRKYKWPIGFASRFHKGRDLYVLTDVSPASTAQPQYL